MCVRVLDGWAEGHISFSRPSIISSTISAPPKMGIRTIQTNIEQQCYLHYRVLFYRSNVVLFLYLDDYVADLILNLTNLKITPTEGLQDVLLYFISSLVCCMHFCWSTEYCRLNTENWRNQEVTIHVVTITNTFACLFMKLYRRWSCERGCWRDDGECSFVHV